MLTSSPLAKLLEQDRVKSFLNSDLALDVLLTRLKQLLNTGEEFARYIKKKAQVEDDHYTQLKKTAAHTRQVSANNGKLKQDSFSRQFDKIVEFDDTQYGVGNAYVKALNVMFDELMSLVDTVLRLRKMIKEEGKRKEKECQDAIVAAEKAKLKYFHLAEDLDRLRTADPNKKLFSLRNRLVTQQEEDMQRKVNAADQDYKMKVTTCKKLKDEIMVLHRPNNSKKLKELILQMDIAMNLQLQKYVTWNENLIMNLGVLAVPLGGTKPSLREIALGVDNEKDLYDYLMKHERAPNSTKALQPVEYQVHPLLAKYLKATQPKTFLNKPDHTTVQAHVPTNNGTNLVPPSNSGPSSGFGTSATSTAAGAVTGAATGAAIGAAASPALPPSYQSTYEPPSTSTLAPPSSTPYPMSNEQDEEEDGYMYSSLDPLASGTPKIGELTGPKPLNLAQPTFGVSVEEVITFAGIDNVPLVVKRCIDVIEQYGMDIEGIYRTLGSKTTVQQLRDQIDQKYTNYLLIGLNIDERNVLDGDIYCVASLLKLYFNLLPEPLLTREYCQLFIETVKLMDETYIAKKMHHLVFKLPDGAYFTLRALIFHLNKVAAHEKNNRMNAKLLAIIWGPAILNDDSLNPQDLGYKSKVVEELMRIANDIFDTDDE